MNDTTYTNLVHQIKQNRTWIDVQSSDTLHEFTVLSGGVLKTGLFRSLVLVCKLTRCGFRKGHEWIIPDFELNKAVHQLKADVQFKRRVRRNRISMEDAERIIHLATCGRVNLELEEW